ncbi:hypothetical protein [Catenulispora rubra]|uniref:hypothetical protein n=1 Tax=Catenulispora rubra TaxID=280293 RepID=UPI001891F962|nr:hypothetical protein [Catenulispora rubra]
MTGRSGQMLAELKRAADERRGHADRILLRSLSVHVNGWKITPVYEPTLKHWCYAREMRGAQFIAKPEVSAAAIIARCTTEQGA